LEEEYIWLVSQNNGAQSHTSADVASWMVSEVQHSGYLLQSRAAIEIKRRFGDHFVYRNNNGNLAITKEVAALFNIMTADCVVWSRKQFMWRPRRPDDKPGRQQ
jgi:hypothetical protein